MSENESEVPQYTVTVNGKRYELNEEVRSYIQDCARQQYSENWYFSCWWKTASEDQYDDDVWDEKVHEAGDPVLVIETAGPVVPWERLDQLNVEMQEAGPESELDREMDDTSDDELDAGNGMRTIDRDAVDTDSDDALDDAEKTIGRTHFSQVPQGFEEVADPDGEEEDKIPAKPMKLGDEPSLVKWVPDHPDVTHTWAAGEAITAVQSRVEWNVQEKANQPRLQEEKDNSHDHWQSILEGMDCESIEADEAGENDTDDILDKVDEGGDADDRDIPDEFENGKAGGGHWRV